MTRDEALYKHDRLDYTDNFYNSGFIDSQTYALVNKIYDDLEKQTCENCTNHEPKHGDCFIMPIDINVMPRNFGCNQFEDKRYDKR